MGKRKDKIIVQDAKPFYQVASKEMNATVVFSIDKTQVERETGTQTHLMVVRLCLESCLCTSFQLEMTV